MNLHSRLNRILCGAGLVFALAVMPATWALSPTGAAKPGAAVANHSHMRLIDINTATVDQLKTLPGIGAGYARRILSGRPYTAKNQLVTKGILPQGVYDKIKGKIVASHGKK
jgi:competence protein ComEA